MPAPDRSLVSGHPPPPMRSTTGRSMLILALMQVVVHCARCKLISSSSFATTSSLFSRSNVLMRFAWRAIVLSLVSAARFWTEISRRLTSQPSQNPGTLRGPGLSNVSSRSMADRRGALGGRALAHVCLTCTPRHARQPPPPPACGLLVTPVSAAICEGPRSVPQGKYSTGTGTTVLDLAVHS